MLTQILSSSRAGLHSAIVTRDTTDYGTYSISDVGITSLLLASGAAAMDGVASVAATGGFKVSVAAHMDGHADMFSTGAFLAPGAAHMDGAASVFVTGLKLFAGAAHMDGLAQVQGTSTTFAPGAAQMDGRASAVVAQSAPGAGLAEMDGAASMAATAPNRYNLYLQDGVIGSGATSTHTGYNVSLLQSIVGNEVLRPRLHYRYTLQNTINLTRAINNRMKFVKVLREVTVTMTPDLQPHSLFHYTLTLPLSVRETPTPKWHAIMSLVQSFAVHPATTPKFIWGRILAEVFKVSTPLDASTHYWTSLAQRFKLSEFEGFKLRHPITLNQNVNLSHMLVGGISVKLLQKLLTSAAASPHIAYHLGLTSGVRVAGLIDKLFFAILTQLFTAHDTPTHAFTAIGSLNQLLTIHPTFNNKLILKLVGNIRVSPEQVVHMLYRGDPLLDGMAITALYISPEGTTTTWVVNTRTNAVTEYDHYDFRSFAQMGNRYVAAGPEGLYELDGDTDDGALIISRLMGGYLQLNEKKMFGIKGVYVAVRGGGRFYLKLISGDGREYIYELKAQPNLMTTKVRVGKGIRTTYMAFELVTEGQDFDLDSIEFIPMTSGRRV